MRAARIRSRINARNAFRSTSLCPFSSSQKGKKERTLAFVHEETATTTTSAPENLLKAPFSKIHAKEPRGLFPWRSSPLLLDRLIPGTDDYHSKGLLVGADLTSSNPKLDTLATACFFLQVPFLDMLFFRQSTEQELADNLAWAFEQAVNEISTGDSHRWRGILEPTKLSKLFEASQEFGSESLEVRLQVQALTSTNRHQLSEELETADLPQIVSLFVFPFLSRSIVQNAESDHPHWKDHLRKYRRLLEGMKESSSSAPTESTAVLSREIMDDFRDKGHCPNTIICQVLLPCLETFWVKETTTGSLVQGDLRRRLVHHLVRFEQVTTTRLDSKGGFFFPFRQELGNWIITDIDDLCDGNLLI